MRLRRRRARLPEPDPGATTRVALLAVQLRAMAAQLRQTSDELAAIHGVDGRNGDTRSP